MTQTSVQPTWLDKGRIPSLDGLRAIAVSLVVFDHLLESQVSHAHPVIREVAKIASEVGVDMFFVLSGFLITTMLCREQARTKSVSLIAFYKRRALRIFPAFVAYLLFVSLLGPLARVDVPRGDWIAAITYTMNFREAPTWEVGHLWSLSIEEHFYLLWPPLLAFLDRRWAVRLLAALLLLEPLARVVILETAPARSSIVELWTPIRTDGIIAGCLLALVCRAPRGVEWLDKAARAWPLALLALIGSLAAGVVSATIDVGATPTIVAFSLATLLWTALRREPRWLTYRWLVVIGVGSYSIYLWQQAFLNPRHAWWTSPPLAIGLVILFAAFSYRVVERPFVRIKDRKAT